MPKYTYTGDAGRVYPFHPEPARTPDVGGVYELPADPADGRWTAVDDKPANVEEK